MNLAHLSAKALHPEEQSRADEHHRAGRGLGDRRSVDNQVIKENVASIRRLTKPVSIDVIVVYRVC